MRETMADVADNAIAPLEPVSDPESLAEGIAEGVVTTVTILEAEGGGATSLGEVDGGKSRVVADEDDAVSVTEVDDTPPTAPEAPEPPEPGAATALEGSARAPAPQGISSPVPG